jgi:hypothetical protein
MNGNTERPAVEYPPSSYPLQDQDTTLTGESAHGRNIPPALLPADDAGKGFAGRVDLGEWVKLQASGLADAAILAGKREAAKQVRPDFQPVKPRLSLGRVQLHQFGDFSLRCLHGSMLPACTIKGEGEGGNIPRNLPPLYGP